MNTIFFGDAASDSGSFGFSEACPLYDCQMTILDQALELLTILPTPHGRSSAQLRPQSTQR